MPSSWTSGLRYDLQADAYDLGHARENIIDKSHNHLSEHSLVITNTSENTKMSETKIRSPIGLSVKPPIIDANMNGTEDQSKDQVLEKPTVGKRSVAMDKIKKRTETSERERSHHRGRAEDPV